MKKIIIVVIILVTMIGLFIAKRSSTPKNEVQVEVPTPIVFLPTITADVIVELTPTSGKNAVVLKIKNIPQDIENIEYEMTYNTADDLTKGVNGKINLKNESEITHDDIVLGTCSSGNCVYDKGVKEINLSLKFNNNKSQSWIFQKSYSL